MNRLRSLFLFAALLLTSCSTVNETWLEETAALARAVPPTEPEETCPSLQEAIGQQIRRAEEAEEKGVSDLPSLPLSPLPLETLARRLAGLGDLGEYTHLSFEERQLFQKAAVEGWKGLVQRTLKPLWGWQEILHPCPASRVFYPFGGPDATYVTQLFPKATEYILVGLEVPGTRRSSLSLFESDAKLALFRESMQTFYQKGYFVTHDMAVQLSSRRAIGVAPLILAQLARLGYTVTSLKALGKKGCSPCTRGLRGLQISFEDKEGTAKTLFYIQCRLDNDNLIPRQALCTFVSRVPFVTFIKSASYALHNGRVFSQLRQFLLDSSQAILQDDSGIPYKFLKKTFNVRLFGSYDKPTLPVFKGHTQAALQEDYASTRSEPLPFCLGYGCTHLPSNLLWATRLTP